MKKKSFSDSDDAVAKEFNEFFNSIGQNTVEKIYSLANECSYDLTQSSFVPRCYLPSQQFSFRPVNCDEVQKVITSMCDSRKYPYAPPPPPPRRLFDLHTRYPPPPIFFSIPPGISRILNGNFAYHPLEIQMALVLKTRKVNVNTNSVTKIR